MNKIHASPEVEILKDGIRPATIEDFPDMVRINIECRKTNYQGFIAQEYLDKLKIEDKLAAWSSSFLQTKDTMSYYVKVIDGKIVGFISGGKNMKAEYPYDNELDSLYVDTNYQGQGVGKELFERLLEDDKFKDCKSFYLWTFKDNPGSNHFYQKMGGKAFEEKTNKRTGAPIVGYLRER